jgi:hypothetical protein
MIAQTRHSSKPPETPRELVNRQVAENIVRACADDLRVGFALKPGQWRQLAKAALGMIAEDRK